MSDIQKNEEPVYVLIQQIKDATLNPKTLDKEARQRCVGILLNESYSVIEMAQLFKTCERTIKRDVDDILEERKMSPNLEDSKKIVGEFWMYAHIHHERLMKLARIKDASVSERLQAEYMAFKVLSEAVSKLQSLGYLPSRPVTIVGDVFHHDADFSTQLEDLNHRIIELGKMADGDDEVTKMIRSDVEGMKKVSEEIKNQIQTNEESKEKDNEKQ
jgi:hypothetical protein